MSLEPKQGKGDFCPNCGTDLRVRLVEDSLPDFCLKCRFPLMLVANKYRLLRQFDEGGFANIYEAEHIHLTRDPKRVVKIIKPEFLNNESLVTRFFREVQVTSALSQRNQHIVRIYDDFGEIPNLGYFYIMEFLEGQPLNDILDDVDGLLPLELCYRLFLQLCDAMQAAHDEHIVHRDLKPHNMFITQQGRESHFLKVIDFGIAKPVGGGADEAQVTQGILGTPAYMAPEQCINKNVGAWSDIYSMGCILYELLVGESPFVPRDPVAQEELSVMEIMSSHLNKPPSLMRDKQPRGRNIPPSLEEVVQKALAKKPAERFKDVEDFERAFLGAMPDAQRPGSYNLSSHGSNRAVTQEKFEDLPVLGGGGVAGGFQIESRYPGQSKHHTPAPYSHSGRNPQPLPDLFSVSDPSELGDSMALDDIPIDIGDVSDLAIQPVLPGQSPPAEARSGGSQPPSRGAVRRVIEINRRPEIPPQRQPSSSPSRATASTSASRPPSIFNSSDLEMSMPKDPPQISLPGSSPGAMRPSGSSAPQRARRPVVYSGRPGVARSPLKQPEGGNWAKPLFFILLTLMVGFFVVQTFLGHRLPWGQIFPWGTQKTHKPKPRKESRLQSPRIHRVPARVQSCKKGLVRRS